MSMLSQELDTIVSRLDDMVVYKSTEYTKTAPAMRQGRFSPWHLWILCLCWTFQIVALAYVDISTSVDLHTTYSNRWYYFEPNSVPGDWAIIAFGYSLLLLTISEMVLLWRRSLQPVFYTIFNLVKTIYWFVLTIVIYTSIDEYNPGIAAPVLYSFAFVFFSIPTIYGALEWRRISRPTPVYDINELGNSHPATTNGFFGAGQETGRTSHETQRMSPPAYGTHPSEMSKAHLSNPSRYTGESSIRPVWPVSMSSSNVRESPRSIRR